MAPEILIIANPASGRQRAPALAEETMRLLRKEGRRAELALTTGPGDAAAKAQAAVAAGVPLVVGCGGDGTLQELAGALAGSPTVLGLLPGGRCNDLAHALGLPRAATPQELAGILLHGRCAAVDLGAILPLAQGGGAAAPGGPPRHFCTVATLGFDSRVSRYVEQHRLPLKGTLAYLYSTLRILLSFQPILLRMRGDFGIFEGRVTLAATGNTAFYGGAMQIAPGARLDDGLFHLCVVGAVPRRTVLRILPKVFSGAHLAHPAVRMLTTRSLEIETPEGAEWICADGESICQTPARLEAKPGALRVQVALGFGGA